MIVIQGEVRLHPEDIEMMREASRAMIAATRAEDGCIAYAYAEDVLEPGLVHVIERWRDQDALTKHGQAPHMAAFNAKLAKARVQGLKIVAYEASGERILMGG